MKTTKAQLIEYFRYLDNLRESGITNMFGAGRYLEEDFGLDKTEARTIVTTWMNTFNGDLPPEDRVGGLQHE